MDLAFPPNPSFHESSQPPQQLPEAPVRCLRVRQMEDFGYLFKCEIIFWFGTRRSVVQILSPRPYSS